MITIFINCVACDFFFSAKNEEKRKKEDEKRKKEEEKQKEEDEKVRP